MCKAIAILIVATIAAVTPLAAYADINTPIGLAASVNANVNAPNVVVGGDAEDNPVIVELNRKLAKMQSDHNLDLKLDIKKLEARELAVGLVSLGRSKESHAQQSHRPREATIEAIGKTNRKPREAAKPRAAR